MKQFISKRTIKVPRYKIFTFYLFLALIFLFILNFLSTIFVNSPLKDSLISFSIKNIVPTSYSLDYSKIFFNNLLGLSLDLETPASRFEEVPKPLDITPSNPLIYLYNTFQTSKYQSSYYSSYTINPVITQANLIFSEYLHNLNISNLVETKSVAKTLKDQNLSYTYSYRASRVLLEQAKKDNPTLAYYFDLQLSSNPKEQTTINLNNQSYALIEFVIGTKNSNYLKNQELATTLNNLLISSYDSLSKVTTQGGEGYHGVYNQDFDDHVLLIKIGGHENTIAEVNRSLSLLAKALSAYLKEEGKIET